jgi:hypothetical protein
VDRVRLAHNMRASLSLVLLLALIASSAAQCTLYFDDCGACLSDSACGWCGDFCTSRDSSLCDVPLTLDNERCPAIDGPHAVASRQNDGCAGRLCSDCMARDGCAICVTIDISSGITLTTNCLANTSIDQCGNNYNTPGTSNSPGEVCELPPGAFTIFIIVINGSPTSSAVQAAIVLSLGNFLVSIGRLFTISAANIFIVGVNAGNILNDRSGSVFTMRQAAQSSYSFTGITPNAAQYPQKDFEDDISRWLDQLDGTLPGGLSVADTGKSRISGGSGGGNDLSDGELAGIIIACIIGAAIIAAIIAYVIIRRRRHGYPAPFRSPAASFRP